MARDHGFIVIDADQVARDVVIPGQPGWHALVDEFGESYLDDKGCINRTALRTRISEDSEAQKKIGELLHPLIRSEIQTRLRLLERQKYACVFVEAALTIESGSYKDYDMVLLVTADEDLRIQRLLHRDGMREETARALIAKQMPDAEKRHFAQYEIVNDTTVEDLKHHFLSFLTRYELKI
jgi:dephospho-CoA kinase